MKSLKLELCVLFRIVTQKLLPLTCCFCPCLGGVNQRPSNLADNALALALQELAAATHHTPTPCTSTDMRLCMEQGCICSKRQAKGTPRLPFATSITQADFKEGTPSVLEPTSRAAAMLRCHGCSDADDPDDPCSLCLRFICSELLRIRSTCASVGAGCTSHQAQLSTLQRLCLPCSWSGLCFFPSSATQPWPACKAGSLTQDLAAISGVCALDCITRCEADR